MHHTLTKASDERRAEIGERQQRTGQLMPEF
jgi:hypothetical protein